ncbi:M23 family metallopeptidase [Microbulbifer echini]|uniref:M23 family metallopeptidase n=1 Tax=Microbulbifer echini TaxID=1529067 RepID=A0ABV4NS18_9GAMM
MENLQSKSVLNAQTPCQYSMVYGGKIRKFIAILLGIFLSLKLVEAKAPSQSADIYKFNTGVLSKVLSFESDQTPLMLVEGAIDTLKSQATAVATVNAVDLEKDVFLSKNQGLLSLLAENMIVREDAIIVVRILSKYLDVNTLAVGERFRLVFDGRSRFQSIRVSLGFAERLEVKRDDQGFFAVKYKNSTTLQSHYVEGEIAGSFYNTGLRLGLSHAALAKLNEILSYEIDFQREILSGDQFTVFYNTVRDDIDGSEIFHSIKFAELALANSIVTLYRYQDEKSGSVDYYHPDGKSSRSFLMKTPLENARLSSYYGRRKHPVLGYTRMHNGLDFGAPLGTPILAAGDGIVERASYFGSFGNYIRIGHRSGIQTVYAHLKGYAKGIKSGVTVEQGQVIGFLGATGRVQGRHLHYEVHKNGKAIDPLGLDLPASNNLTGKALEVFYKHIDHVNNDLSVYR